jgi:hypothetical protein
LPAGLADGETGLLLDRLAVFSITTWRTKPEKLGMVG